MVAPLTRRCSSMSSWRGSRRARHWCCRRRSSRYWTRVALSPPLPSGEEGACRAGIASTNGDARRVQAASSGSIFRAHPHPYFGVEDALASLVVDIDVDRQLVAGVGGADRLGEGADRALRALGLLQVVHVHAL